MMTACSRFGIREIPAVELDCIFEGVDLHLLGYGIDFQDPRYRELEEDILSQKRKIRRGYENSQRHRDFFLRRKRSWPCPVMGLW